MSHNSSPNHASPSSVDSFYDHTFTAEISSKMRVPDKICVVEGAEPTDYILHHNNEMKSTMNVPGRIIVAGGDKHIAVRESVPEMKFDSLFPINLPNLVLAPPPDVLTVDEYPCPIVPANKPQKIEKKTEYEADNSILGTNNLNETTMNSSLYAGDEDVSKLRTQVRHLSRRVLAIEQENQQRQQREKLIFIIGGIYFIIKSVVWINRHL